MSAERDLKRATEFVNDYRVRDMFGLAAGPIADLAENFASVRAEERAAVAPADAPVGIVIDPDTLTPDQFEGAEAVQVWRIEARNALRAQLPYQFVLAYPSAADAEDSAAHAAAATLEALGVKLSLVRVVKGVA